MLGLTIIGKDRIRSLESRLEALEQAPKRSKTAIKVLRTEWEDTLDRIQRVLSRLNARHKRAEKVEAEEPEGEVATPGGVGTHAILEAHRRRKRGLLPG